MTFEDQEKDLVHQDQNLKKLLFSEKVFSEKVFCRFIEST